MKLISVSACHMISLWISCNDKWIHTDICPVFKWNSGRSPLKPSVLSSVSSIFLFAYNTHSGFWNLMTICLETLLLVPCGHNTRLTECAVFYLRYSCCRTEYSYLFQSTMNHYQGTSIKLYCIKLKLLCQLKYVSCHGNNVYQISIPHMYTYST
jgi:hypothetical protein